MNSKIKAKIYTTIIMCTLVCFLGVPIYLHKVALLLLWIGITAFIALIYCVYKLCLTYTEEK